MVKENGKLASSFGAQEFARAAEAEAKLAKIARKSMLDHVGSGRYSAEDFEKAEPDDWKHTDGRDDYCSAEVAIAKRCHGFHLELLSLDSSIPTPSSSHYKLVHYDIPLLDAAAHRVQITGLVDKELSLSLSDVKQRPSTTESVLMACAGQGRTLQQKRFWTHAPWGPDAFGCSQWTGCSLADLLKEAGLKEGAKQVIFTGADKGIEGNQVQHFQRSLSLEDCLKGHVLVVYQMNGEDLSPAHGAPLRIVVPGWYGMASVKWLTKIEVTSGGFWGYQMDAYSFKRTAKDPKAVPLTRLPVRALMAPPGFPDFVSRARIVPPGTHRIVGKAWAGAVEIDCVEFSSNNGETWDRCVLQEKNGLFGWATWHFDWVAAEGRTAILCCRAFDKEGRSQDRMGSAIFNYGAFGGTAPQQVYVKVDSKVSVDGYKIDLEVEQKAAKPRLLSPLPDHYVQALYQAPGSQ